MGTSTQYAGIYLDLPTSYSSEKSLMKTHSLDVYCIPDILNKLEAVWNLIRPSWGSRLSPFGRLAHWDFWRLEALPFIQEEGTNKFEPKPHDAGASPL